ncbi:MAG: NAD(P)/FAD-dependent oxidoreductase [Candidatus Omnitrophica bacterium]|nr:NAD(P)/FAD-dependent oxidoreductase [Candidatus Omnitrophota bacterium]
MDKTDITIIGAGVIGLAAAYKLAGKGRDITVIEKYSSFGHETSSRNSEVIHSGIYYPKKSIKSEACIRGKYLLYELCERYRIPYRKLGKLVLATTSEEAIKITAIYRNAIDCGVGNVCFMDSGAISKLEPDIHALCGFLSPDTGIIDTHRLMDYFYQTAKTAGVTFAFSVEVCDVKRRHNGYEVFVKEPHGDTFSFESGVVINCAGLSADTIAMMAGIDIERCGYKIRYAKGQYFRIRNPQKFRITHPVYPPPTGASLGIHITPDLAGGLRLGPDAHYVAAVDYEVDAGAQQAFFESVKTFLPALEYDDISMDTAGVRPKLHGPERDFADFVIRNESDKGLDNFINVLGIESPGLTSCLPIAERIQGLVK